jgi:polyhydroxyalkanoate synthesis regulator phasin
MATIGDIRKFMEGTVGRLTPAKAQELARSVMQGAGKEQVSKAAQEILDWSNKNRQRISDLVRTEVRSQMASMGFASKDEVDALKKRVRELERGRPKRATAKKRTTAKKTATAKPAAAAPETSATTPASAGNVL